MSCDASATTTTFRSVRMVKRPFSLGADATRTNWTVWRRSVRRYAPTARERISDFRQTLFRCTAECGIKPQLPRGCASHWSVAVRVFSGPTSCLCPMDVLVANLRCRRFEPNSCVWQRTQRSWDCWPIAVWKSVCRTASVHSLVAWLSFRPSNSAWPSRRCCGGFNRQSEVYHGYGIEGRRCYLLLARRSSSDRRQTLTLATAF